MAFCLMSSWTFIHLIRAVFLAWEVTEVARDPEEVPVAFLLLRFSFSKE